MGYERRASGSGNATVPDDAAIQPPQAFVDCVPLMLIDAGIPQSIDLSGKGITKFVVGTDLFSDIGASAISTQVTLDGKATVNLSNNALTQQSVDAMLADLIAAGFSAVSGSTLNISGGTNAVPTQDKMTVSGAGSADANGDYTSGSSINGKLAYTSGPNSVVWTGVAWEFRNSVEAALYNSPDNTQYPWQATYTAVGAGVEPLPTFASHGNASIDTLVAGGWTITTN